jgi:hypothetical protein
MLRKIGFSVAIVLLASVVHAQTTLTKSPDLGAFWNPLSPNGGTYVYANCFIAPAGADVWPHTLGYWLLTQAPPPPTVRFEIWAIREAAAPTPTMSWRRPGPSARTPAASSSSPPRCCRPRRSSLLAPVYWFAATVVGIPGTGSYQVGGHTQNSQQNDNCTFWYSNDPNGINFDGQNLTRRWRSRSPSTTCPCRWS